MSELFKIKCVMCGTEKQLKRSWARFCSIACKNKSSIINRAKKMKKEKVTQ